MPTTIQAEARRTAQSLDGSMIPAALQGVTHRYDSAHGTAAPALRDFSLTLQPGEVVALLGPNGAGKTTAIKLLLGLLTPTGGTARVFGQDPRRTRTRERIGTMLQVAKLPETLRCREFLNLFRSYYPTPLPLEPLINATGLRGIEKKEFRELSGGQKQRLLFALALCGNPDLVFLDEPTLGMDIETRHALWAQVRDLSARGKTVLLTTHYLEEADTLADRIVVMAQGAVIAEGTPTEVKSRVTGRKLRCVTALTAEVLRRMPGVLTVETLGATTTLTVSNAEDVLRHLLAADLTLHSLEVTSPNLEDAFLALTQNS